MNTPLMRAKVRVADVSQPWDGTERVLMTLVTEKPFDKDGNSEDNSFARWTPSGSISLDISNPALHGKLQVGAKFYVDFIPA